MRLVKGLFNRMDGNVLGGKTKPQNIQGPPPVLILTVGVQPTLRLVASYLLSGNSVHLSVILGTNGESYRLDLFLRNIIDTTPKNLMGLVWKIRVQGNEEGNL